MHILLAPDSFKGSLTSLEAATIMKQAILSIDNEATVTLKPMADGGEGTVDVILASTTGQKINVTCTGPLGETIHTYYAILQDHTAIIEIANIAGLVQVPKPKRNPENTTSFGLGEVIKDALDRGCSSLIIGLGGSATNDGGLGCLQALGMKAWKQDGSQADVFGKDLLDIDHISFADIDPRLEEVTIHVACDVDNPLIGLQGASSIYGPQKGATEQQVTLFDEALAAYASLLAVDRGKDFSNNRGSGAAGGLGFALLTIGARLTSGAALIAEATQLHQAMKQADFIITGEGQSDEQTLSGKAPGYVVELANTLHVPALLISGALSGDLTALRKQFHGCFSIVNRPLSVEESMEQAQRLLYDQTINIFQLIRAIIKN
ncbi:glycerate kinase [Virgibacillus sp. M23]|uniref:glycerate kinase n=1 Tax=Virgibacillus sp. M23 TaxID=3079030 RepID=UPI002A9198D6|nr:glycerate kinase [Virgibacillus sp. M23]MDY7046086.1 glycerate kinase [Virgibacillus sp. M23]